MCYVFLLINIVLLSIGVCLALVLSTQPNYNALATITTVFTILSAIAACLEKLCKIQYKYNAERLRQLKHYTQTLSWSS